jgi:hypothetical protein
MFFVQLNLGKKYFPNCLNFDWINMSINETVQKETEEKNNSKTKNNDPQDLLRTQISVLKSKPPIIDNLVFMDGKISKESENLILTSIIESIAYNGKI